MIVGVPKETSEGERRVALVPELVSRLSKAGLELLVENGAGVSAGFPDAAYQQQGASLDSNFLSRADIVLKVQPPNSSEIQSMKESVLLIGFLAPYNQPEMIKALAARKATAFAMELMPRITRAQSMDTLSAMSTVSGYKAVLLAASRLNILPAAHDRRWNAYSRPRIHHWGGRRRFASDWHRPPSRRRRRGL